MVVTFTRLASGIQPWFGEEISPQDAVARRASRSLFRFGFFFGVAN